MAVPTNTGVKRCAGIGGSSRTAAPTAHYAADVGICGQERGGIGELLSHDMWEACLQDADSALFAKSSQLIWTQLEDQRR